MLVDNYHWTVGNVNFLVTCDLWPLLSVVSQLQVAKLAQKYYLKAGDLCAYYCQMIAQSHP